jgi:hypothetical protein
MRALHGHNFVPAFATGPQASEFGAEAVEYFKRLVPGVERPKFEVESSDAGFIAIGSLRFEGWGRERGAIYCSGMMPGGLVLRDRPSRQVYLEVKHYVWTAKSETGVLYVGFADGTGIGRKSVGVQMGVELFKRIVFGNRDRALEMVARGGQMQVYPKPRKGLCPICLFHEKPRGVINQWYPNSTVMCGEENLSGHSFVADYPIEHVWPSEG